MNRNVISLTLVVLIMLFGVVLAVEWLSQSKPVDGTSFVAANQLYQVGHYVEAAQIYEQLISQGQEESGLFYNLGNTYYQQGDLGRAILNYERAARLDPRDQDIHSNLTLARAQAIDIYLQPNGPLTSLAELTSSWLSLNETAMLALFLWIACGSLLLIWRQLLPGRAKAGVQNLTILVFSLVIISGLLLGSRIYQERTQPGGIIIVPEVGVSSSPEAGYLTDFSLFGGTEVRLLERHGDWARLELLDESTEAWIPLDAVEPLAVHLQPSPHIFPFQREIPKT